MMYVYDRMMDQLVTDRHQALAELYGASRRPGAVARKIGSFLIRVGERLRQDVELPAMTASTRPELNPGGC